MVKMKEYTTSYAVEKRFEHLFTGHRIDVDRSGRVMLASCHASVNLTDLESGRLLREVRVAPETSVDSATEEDYVITFGFREDRLVVAYNSGLLRHWRLEVFAIFKSSLSINTIQFFSRVSVSVSVKIYFVLGKVYFPISFTNIF